MWCSQLLEPVNKRISEVKTNPSSPERAMNLTSSLGSTLVVALGEMKDVRAVEPLKAALKDENVSVRHAAEDALSKIRHAHH